MKNFLKRYWPVFLLCLALGGIAGAAVVDRIISAQWFQSGFYNYPTSVSRTISTRNKVTRILGSDAACVYDFAAVPDRSCVDNTGMVCTVTGARLGDKCILGNDVGVNTVDSTVSCYVSAADTVKIHACASPGDAGSFNPADAGYSPLVFSNQ